jgi:hypothetical protein
MKYEEWLAHFNEKHDNKGRFAKKSGSATAASETKIETPHDRRYENTLIERDTYARSIESASARYKYQVDRANEYLSSGDYAKYNEWAGYANETKRNLDFYKKMVKMYDEERLPVIRDAIEDYEKNYKLYNKKKSLKERVTDSFKRAISKTSETVSKIKKGLGQLVNRVSNASEDEMSSFVSTGKKFLDNLFG